jgi:hypothetical protein
MVWAGTPFARKIEFSTGLPTGAVSFSLMGNDGSEIRAGTVAHDADAISTLLVIDGADNSCDKPFFENRTVTWNYVTSEGVVSDRVTYRVDKPLPFAVSPEGVRGKIGIENHELVDELVDLVTAYSEFSSMVDPDALATAASAGDRSTLLCLHAIEAIAALMVLPTIQLRAPQKETSGTNEFARFNKIDWSRIELDLVASIARARAEIDPTFDGTGAGAFMFGTAPRETDAITGA